MDSNTLFKMLMFYFFYTVTHKTYNLRICVYFTTLSLLPCCEVAQRTLKSSIEFVKFSFFVHYSVVKLFYTNTVTPTIYSIFTLNLYAVYFNLCTLQYLLRIESLDRTTPLFILAFNSLTSFVIIS